MSKILNETTKREISYEYWERTCMECDMAKIIDEW